MTNLSAHKYPPARAEFVRQGGARGITRSVLRTTPHLPDLPVPLSSTDLSAGVLVFDPAVASNHRESVESIIRKLTEACRQEFGLDLEAYPITNSNIFAEVKARVPAGRHLSDVALKGIVRAIRPKYAKKARRPSKLARDNEELWLARMGRLRADFKL